ncbi:hypothetical protein NDU88_006305 [Pleurodeles waltl]|uniref:Uncharacterized protein n=1 Tax=Pleurodeles waltl TaxID=8319 RepID=A0AAV7RL29_PLEWA|nr:hypothetical protein NDU88_006305 [Pleurodeles waltl]
MVACRVPSWSDGRVFRTMSGPDCGLVGRILASLFPTFSGVVLPSMCRKGDQEPPCQYPPGLAPSYDVAAQVLERLPLQQPFLDQVRYGPWGVVPPPFLADGLVLVVACFPVPKLGGTWPSDQ